MKKRSPEARLAALRRQIDRADHAILRALAARFDAVREIAKVKRAAGIPIVQSSRWKEVLRTRLAEAEKLGLARSFVRATYQSIHAEAIRLQRSKTQAHARKK